ISQVSPVAQGAIRGLEWLSARFLLNGRWQKEVSRSMMPAPGRPMSGQPVTLAVQAVVGVQYLGHRVGDCLHSPDTMVRARKHGQVSARNTTHQIVLDSLQRGDPLVEESRVHGVLYNLVGWNVWYVESAR